MSKKMILIETLSGLALIPLTYVFVVMVLSL
jgi:hypothetical protein